MLNGKYYALKIIPKNNLNTLGRLKNLINEPNILKQLNKNQNFVPEIICSFQDYENFYLVTTFYDGPSLDKLIFMNFTENQIKFISACIILSLKYIRENKIIHRDLTITNIIMDEDKYFNLIDFSFSVEYSQRHSKYLKCNINKKTTPPEILFDYKYDYNLDYYGLGCIIFFLIFKKYPWDKKKRNNITELILENNLIGKFSSALYDFVEKLIIVKYEKRIGFNDIYELINHTWFDNYNWEKLMKKEIISPFYYNKTKVNKNKCKYFIRLKKRNEIYKHFIKENYNQSLHKFDFSKNILKADI